LRLALATIAGALLGINRTERGRAAGLRTMMLVCLAGCVAMILTNVLLDTTGKTSDYFTQMDTMRLPLGVLTGMGFIGAGAIIQRGSDIQGITTAATLWLTTVIGFCFGSAQHGLGIAGTALAIGALWGLEGLEASLPRDRQASLTVTARIGGPTAEDLRARVLEAGYHISSWEIGYRADRESPCRTLRCGLHRRGKPEEFVTPPFVEQLARHPDMIEVEWKV
jgi:putative Mg2+ transporter-C (MgtC) family protein